MKGLTLTLCLLWMASPAPVEGQSVGLNLQRAIDSVRIMRNIEGVSAAVLLPGHSPWRGVSGVCHGSESITPVMKFDIADNTIPFISTMILELAEEGLLSLDDSLGSYLPPFPNITGSVTIRQLLNMTSGLSPYDTNAVDAAVFSLPSKYWTPEGSLGTFVGPPVSLPGREWVYCNTNYVLLGMVIRHITGTSVSSQLRQRIFTPLSLDSTHFGGEEAISGPNAHPWYKEYGDISSASRNAIYSIAWSAGAIVSTAEDMAWGARALFEGSLITKASRDQMLTSVPLPEPSRTRIAGLQLQGYGLGAFEGTYAGLKVYLYDGKDYGYSSVMAYVPELGASFAALMNQSDGEPLEVITAILNQTLSSIAVLATPRTIDFGSVAPGFPDSIHCTIRNVNRLPIEIESIETVRPTPFGIFDSPSLPRLVPPGDSLVFGVVFRSATGGTFQDTILVKLADSTLLEGFIPLSGKSVTTGAPGRESARAPDVFALFQNYPNPFNPTTAIRFQLPAACNIRLVFYDLLGREVATLDNGWRAPGTYEVKFDATAYSSGVYVYRLQAGNYFAAKRLLLLR